MANRILMLLLVFIVTFSTDVKAQLSDKAINEIADTHAEKWSQYLDLSNYRKAELTKVWKLHEQKKSVILQTTNNLKSRLQKENQRFMSDLNNILTSNELKVYEMFEELRREDDREYLESLVKAISNDTLFIAAYTDLQYSKIFPFNMAVRMELEESISRADRAILDSARTEIIGLYDKCLLTCLVEGHDHHDLFDDIDELLIVEINKELEDSESAISQLVKLTNKYEARIHEIMSSHKEKFDYWTKVTKELKDEYILESHNTSIQELRKRNSYATLKHVESEAIFLLLDPFDHHVSRKVFNLKVYNQL